MKVSDYAFQAFGATWLAGMLTAVLMGVALVVWWLLPVEYDARNGWFFLVSAATWTMVASMMSLNAAYNDHKRLSWMESQLGLNFKIVERYPNMEE